MRKCVIQIHLVQHFPTNQMNDFCCCTILNAISLMIPTIVINIIFTKKKSVKRKALKRTRNIALCLARCQAM